MNDFQPPILPNLYRDPSGIYRVRPSPASVTEVPQELLPEVGPMAFGHLPTFLDQLYSYTTARELINVLFDDELAGYLGGIPHLSRHDAVDLIRDIPLEPAIRLSVSLQRRVRLYPTDQAEQLKTMAAFYGPVFAAAAEVLLKKSPRRSLFSEQQAFAFQRLLMLHAKDAPAEDLTREELARLLWAFLWIPDAVLDPDLAVDERLTGWELHDERLLRFFVSNGGLATHTALRHELARGHRMYAVIANSVPARRHRDYCPLDAWLQEAYGVNFTELQTLGFALFARSNVGDRSDGQLLYANAEYFSTTTLAGRYERALEAIAAPSEWFRAEFRASRESPRRSAYEIQPFLRRPALIQHDGNAVVLGLRALEGWLGATGAYYRFFDLARARGH